MLHLAFPSPRSWQPPVFVLPPWFCLFPNVAGWKHTAHILFGRTFFASEHASENTELLTSFSQGRAPRRSRIPSQGQSTPSPSVIARATMETKIGSPRNSHRPHLLWGSGSAGGPLWEKVTGAGREWVVGLGCPPLGSPPQASPVLCEAGSALGCSVSPQCRGGSESGEAASSHKVLASSGQGVQSRPHPAGEMAFRIGDRFLATGSMEDEGTSGFGELWGTQ